MKINHKIITTTLRWVTLSIFAVALGFKLYNIYKYGGTKTPAPPNPNDEEPQVTDYPDTINEAAPVTGYNSYEENDKDDNWSSTQHKYN